MLPMRSIELSIIQPQAADLQMRKRKRKQRRKCRGMRGRKRGGKIRWALTSCLSLPPQDGKDVEKKGKRERKGRDGRTASRQAAALKVGRRKRQCEKDVRAT